MIIPDPKSLTIPSNPAISDSSVASIQHRTRKVARQTKFVFKITLNKKRKKDFFFTFRFQSDSKSQLQPYKNHEADYDDFIHTIDRKNDTLYFVSFKRVRVVLLN